ncbi:flavin reductase family protein [Luteithermobacter gelatinilyticus]|uniref:flavin reductase family protein n=1 Tax=Luteithermobacter gelatinilyticus TaxID=2582913 RepID=UPI001105A905|nr:flavin reductase family protein [Luteithermobacter gelatinilyticus]
MTNPTSLAAAMRRYASSVSVVSCRDREGNLHAMTATAVSSVSFDPPSMLICVNKQAQLNGAMAGVDAFAINILSEEQTDISNICAGGKPALERVNDEHWIVQDHKPPVLKGAQAIIHCIKTQCFSYGSHDIFIGDVTGVSVEGNVRPLIYLDGKYGTFAPFQEA